MQHDRKTLLWQDANKRQVREVLMRNGISSMTWFIAFGQFMSPEWAYGPHLYLIDTLTDKGARVTIQGPEEFDIKVSSRTGTELLDDLTRQHDAMFGKGLSPTLDKIVVLD